MPTSVRVPSALGPGPSTPLGEFAEFVQDALAAIGVVLPDADAGKIDAAQHAWTDLAVALRRHRAEVDQSLHIAVSAGLPQHARIASCRDAVARRIDDTAAAADSIAAYVRTLGDAVGKAWEEIGWLLAQMAAEIVLEIGVGVLLSTVTFGAGAIATAAKITFTVARWVLRIAEVCHRLTTLIRTALTAARLAGRGAAHLVKDSIAAGVAGVASQIGFNELRAATDPTYERQSLSDALAGGLIAGVVGGASGAALPNSGPIKFSVDRVHTIDLVNHEAAGGHVIARHVDKSVDYLKGRNIEYASTFVDLATASAATRANLLTHQAKITEWLAGSKPKLVLDGTMNPQGGRVWVRSTHEFVKPSGIRTVLHRSTTLEIGFRITTSYPTP
ncbi:hypothetical protein FLP10_11460 [Agromyces intestinalis]|uniref:Bacterial CdiA-CT RNAse A domain-containing protein n=1 Tax=Agromyces intestinalis TaxID=2592652 RepID=A0A5C1YFK0_9MICO|nr:RNase A-like domain-containing protein [Agromyces intestinalis]QEO14966.1 hypothetical protein FLP10_11460 [Agromyces intestinalis]